MITVFRLKFDLKTRAHYSNTAFEVFLLYHLIENVVIRKLGRSVKNSS